MTETTPRADYVGKVRERETLLDLLEWRGTERVLAPGGRVLIKDIRHGRQYANARARR